MTATVSPPLLIFTDLDGTLLDHHSYSWTAAQSALDLARDRQIPIIFTTSKTLAESLAIQKAMGVSGPIIFENGAGVALPKVQFPALNHLEEQDACWLRVFAMPYAEVRGILAELRDRSRYAFCGFADMTAEEITSLTGLNPTAAANARQRRHGEPLVWRDSEARLEAFHRALRQRGLSLTRGGRFLHVQGPSDKGAAMDWLVRQYPGPLRTAALGDSDNDRSMLQRADIAVVVRSPVQDPITVAREPAQAECIVTSDTGPTGWNRAVQAIIRESVDG